MLRIAAAAAHFTRDLDFDLERIGVIIAHAREAGVGLLALPDGALGGYITDLRPRDHEVLDLPPALEPNGDEVRSVIDLAGDMVVCLGYCEKGPDGELYNSAVALCGDGILGRHRKVHHPAGVAKVFTAGCGFHAFDTPVGRLGMLIDHDKTFPESARSLAMDGAQVIACLSAWPTSLTNRAPRMAQDRQARLFDLYDQARAAENQVLLLSANQSGRSGALHFLGRAKVVGPGGEILARTWSKGGLAVTEVDPAAMVDAARAVLHHLDERRPSAYRT
ncbi:carbon-nitrogen hydrolase family protein [Actinomycetospora sp. TBRC 11914]|uniref:carbon-nitrogen hydrolase family protein n=1 Tax=Actinomycetospora sp. TBRC 11914 TaxID=2729387 RepID=UPI00145D6DF5|nr:carbon-nitrogen hydrolase family protein [Actinomycetospora sp. TBRC 11914]NMO88746.1 carbon-nitrogen hydrolase family protein [Actinomycetospora sp. TBRC 11914]